MQRQEIDEKLKWDNMINNGKISKSFSGKTKGFFLNDIWSKFIEQHINIC